MSNYKLKQSFIHNSIIFYRISFFSPPSPPPNLATNLLYSFYHLGTKEEFRHFCETENASNQPPAKLQFTKEGVIRYFKLYLTETPSEKVTLDTKVLLTTLWRFYYACGHKVEMTGEVQVPSASLQLNA